jgi:hypothetical protein
MPNFAVLFSGDIKGWCLLKNYAAFFFRKSCKF